MKDKNTYWYKLIAYWVKVKRRTGLTIPFIIGAKQYFEPEAKLETVTELLEWIKNSDIDEEIVLRPCDHVGDYVLGLNDKITPMKGNYLGNQFKEKTTLLATIGVLDYGDFEKLCNSLENKYKGYISVGEFSVISYKKWGDFTKEEIKTIEEAKNYNFT